MNAQEFDSLVCALNHIFADQDKWLGRTNELLLVLRACGYQRPKCEKDPFLFRLELVAANEPRLRKAGYYVDGIGKSGFPTALDDGRLLVRIRRIVPGMNFDEPEVMVRNRR